MCACVRSLFSRACAHYLPININPPYGKRVYGLRAIKNFGVSFKIFLPISRV